MRSLRGTILALGAALGAVGVAGIVEMGCGSNSSSATDSGTDATDGEVETGTETGSETGPDSAPEAMTDGGPDVMPDVVFADSDAGPIGYVVALAEATAYCTKWLSCCPQDAGYNVQGCINATTTFGWEGTLPLLMSVYYRGNITVNQTKAASCVNALNAFPCGMQTAGQWEAITAACEGVIQGTIATNSPGCVDSFECAPGNYCDPTVDGGLCTALATQGQPCNTKIRDPYAGTDAGGGIAPYADQMCSYLGSGQPALFCDLIRNGPNAATCQPLLANGTMCTSSVNSLYYDDQACTAGLCGDDSLCGDPALWPYPSFCQFWPQDAGGPG
jgi:hypothetical protein